MCRQLDNKDIDQLLGLVGRFVAISMTDQEGVIKCVSEAFCELTGYKQAEIVGKTHAIFKDPETPDELYKKMWETITKGKLWRGRVKSRTKSCQVYWVDITIEPLIEGNEIIAYVAISKNITNEVAFEKLAKIDALTGLLNRYAIEEEIQSHIQETKRYNFALSLIMIDIDDFKQTNDRYGHFVGDEVLQSIAEILRQTLRETDKIGRWGGEEFMIMLPHTSNEEAIELAERLRQEIAMYDFMTAGHKTASFGIALYKNNENFTTFANRADQALYLAKKKGKNKVC